MRTSTESRKVLNARTRKIAAVGERVRIAAGPGDRDGEQTVELLRAEGLDASVAGCGCFWGGFCGDDVIEVVLPFGKVEFFSDGTVARA